MKAALFLGAVLAGWLAVAPPADAGGWAVSSIEAVPEATEGNRVEVGFMILQHGVTPVSEDNIGDVAVVLRSADGTDTEFPATQQGKVGRFVADVQFPEAGSYTWRIEQGWFGPQDLGPLEVSPRNQPGAAQQPTFITEPAAPLAIRVLLPLVAGAGLLLFVVDIRRRPPAVQATT